MKLIKSIRNWLSRWTWKKVGKLAKSVLISIMAKRLKDLLKEIAEERDNVKENIAKAKDRFDTDRIVDTAFEKVEDSIEKMLDRLIL